MRVSLRIEKLVEGGDGFARSSDGQAVFVRGGLPGELVQAELSPSKGDYGKAVVETIDEPSPDRTTPICPWYGVCGGCDLQHLSWNAQIACKRAILKENFRRLGKIDLDAMEDALVELPVATGPEWGYRSRVRFHVDLASGVSGFLALDSNELIGIDACPVLRKPLDSLLGVKHDLLLKAAMIRKRQESWQHHKTLVEVPAFAGDRGVSLSGHQVDVSLLGTVLHVDSNVFFQSNLFVLPAMAQFVNSHAVGSVVVDLYAGVGTFASCVREAGRTVVAVERDKRCLDLARSHLPDVEFQAVGAEHWVKIRKHKIVDTVIVDPPRGGLGEQVIDAICAWKPHKIIYISCSSVTLARDIGRFAKQGFAPTVMQMFDLYPQTSHIETGVVLSR